MAGSPTTIFAGTTGPKGDRPGPDRIFIRLLWYVIIILLFPLSALAFLGWLALFVYARMPWWVPAPVAFLFLLLSFPINGGPAGAVADHFDMWGDIATGFRDTNGFGSWLAGNAGNLILQQFWFAATLGTFAAAAVAGWKWMRRPRWEERMIRPGLWLQRRVKNTTADIAAGKDSPEEGVTVGVAVDLRDPRFAGGKPGAQYGTRAILLDAEAAGHCLTVGGSGSGKLLSLDTPIPTPHGFKNMGALEVGDLVFGSDGQPVMVTGAYDVELNAVCYEVVFSDGSVITAGAEHLWTVNTAASRKNLNRDRSGVERKRIGSETEIKRFKKALRQVKEGELVSSAQIVELFDKERQPLYAYGFLSDIAPAGTTKIGPFAQNYSGKTVMKTRTVPAWDARTVYLAVLARIDRFYHDQRHLINTDKVTLTTQQIKDTLLSGTDNRCNYSIPLAGVAWYAEQSELPVDPYLLGVWLGDGYSRQGDFCGVDHEIAEFIREAGYSVVERKPRKEYKNPDFRVWKVEGLLPTLRSMGLIQKTTLEGSKKRIPVEYMFSSEEQRRALIAGLVDTDGCHEGNSRVTFANKNKLLIDQVVTIVASLGHRPTVTSKYVMSQDGKEKMGPYYTVSWQSTEDVFRLPRKRDAHRAARGTFVDCKNSERYIVEVRPVESVPMRCISVAAEDSLYLAGETYIATHNTTTMLMGMRDVMRRGHGLIVVDCKGGPDVPDQVAEWASRYGRKFYHWSMQDPRTQYDGPADAPAYYDPIGRGDPSRQKDLILGSQHWDVEYYKSVIGDYLQTAFTVIDLVPPPPGTDTLKDIADLLSPPALLRRATPIPRDKYPNLSLALEKIGMMGDQEKSGINNMYARLNTITSSIAGSWLKFDPEGVNDIDLLDIADKGEVVVFSLDSSNYEETSALLAGLIVQDLKTVSSALREQPAAVPCHVYIDEFSAVDATNIYGLLAKARDAKMSVTLATQALADLKRKEQHFDSQVVGIVSSFLIHRANTEEDARIYAGLSGLEKKMLHRMGVEGSTGTLGTLGAASSTGSGFLEEKEMYRVDPGVFQGLKQGYCVMIAKIPEERYISPVRVVKEDPAAAAQGYDEGVEVEYNVRVAEVRAQGETFQVAYEQQWSPSMVQDLPSPDMMMPGSDLEGEGGPVVSPLPNSGSVDAGSVVGAGFEGKQDRDAVEREYLAQLANPVPVAPVAKPAVKTAVRPVVQNPAVPVSPVSRPQVAVEPVSAVEADTVAEDSQGAAAARRPVRPTVAKSGKQAGAPLPGLPGSVGGAGGGDGRPMSRPVETRDGSDEWGTL